MKHLFTFGCTLWVVFRAKLNSQDHPAIGRGSINFLDKEDTISGLNRGAMHNGKLLCDECLPKGHKHAF